MAYPYGAGPEAGRFAAQLVGGGATVGSDTSQIVALPSVLTARAEVIPEVEADWPDLVIVSTVGPPPAGHGWLVQRVTISAMAQSSAWIYVGGLRPEHLVAGTAAGAMDDYDPVNMLPVRSGERLYVKWRFRSYDTDEAWVRIEYWEVPT